MVKIEFCLCGIVQVSDGGGREVVVHIFVEIAHWGEVVLGFVRISAVGVGVTAGVAHF